MLWKSWTKKVSLKPFFKTTLSLQHWGSPPGCPKDVDHKNKRHSHRWILFWPVGWIKGQCKRSSGSTRALRVKVNHSNKVDRDHEDVQKQKNFKIIVHDCHLVAAYCITSSLPLSTWECIWKDKKLRKFLNCWSKIHEWKSRLDNNRGIEICFSMAAFTSQTWKVAQDASIQLMEESN